MVALGTTTYWHQPSQPSDGDITTLSDKQKPYFHSDFLSSPKFENAIFLIISCTCMENHIQGCTMNETLAVKWLLLVYLYCYLFRRSSFLSEGLGLLLESFLADAPATNCPSLRPSEILKAFLSLKEIFTATRMRGGWSFSPALENCAASSWAPQCQSGTLLSPEVALPCRQHAISLWLLKRPFLCLYFSQV